MVLVIEQCSACGLKKLRKSSHFAALGELLKGRDEMGQIMLSNVSIGVPSILALDLLDMNEPCLIDYSRLTYRDYLAASTLST